MAEIHRRLMKRREYYRKKYQEEGLTFFNFLKRRWKEFMPHKAVGACSDNRFNFTNCRTDWSDLVEEIYQLFMRFQEVPNPTSNKTRMQATLVDICRLLRTETDENGKSFFKGAGPFTTVLFLQMASLLGLIPLHCYSYADIFNASHGPGSLIRVAKQKPKYTAANCDKYLKEVHQTLVKIWSPSITLSLLENMFCEIYRSYNESVKVYYTKNPKTFPKPGLDILLDDNYRVESTASDVFFHDERRDCVQNLFLVRQTGSGESDLRPMLLMKHSRAVKDGDSSNAVIPLTNWVQDRNDPMNIHWEVAPNMISLSTRLKCSKKFKEMMRLD